MRDQVDSENSVEHKQRLGNVSSVMINATDVCLPEMIDTALMSKKAFKTQRQEVKLRKSIQVNRVMLSW